MINAIDYDNTPQDIRCNGNGNGKDKIQCRMDNPPSFSAAVRPSYFITMAEDKQIQAVQEATVL
jgi:hypothetical protein